MKNGVAAPSIQASTSAFVVPVIGAPFVFLFADRSIVQPDTVLSPGATSSALLVDALLPPVPLLPPEPLLPPVALLPPVSDAPLLVLLPQAKSPKVAQRVSEHKRVIDSSVIIRVIESLKTWPRASAYGGAPAGAPTQPGRGTRRPALGTAHRRCKRSRCSGRLRLRWWSCHRCHRALRTIRRGRRSPRPRCHRWHSGHRWHFGRRCHCFRQLLTIRPQRTKSWRTAWFRRCPLPHRYPTGHRCRKPRWSRPSPRHRRFRRCPAPHHLRRCRSRRRKSQHPRHWPSEPSHGDPWPRSRGCALNTCLCRCRSRRPCCPARST